MPRPLRYLIPATFTEQDLAAIAEGNGWRYAGERQDEQQPGLERVWIADDGPTFVSWVEDYTIGLRYLAVNGKNAAEIATTLTQSAPVIEKSDALQMVRAAKNRDETIAGVYVIAAYGNDPDPELLAELEKTFANEDTEVRRASIFAALYTEWPQLEPLLERMQESDPDAQNREMAGIALDNLRRQAWGKE